MGYHRIISVPVCQIHTGDVVLVYPRMKYQSINMEMEYFFSGAGHGQPLREPVVDVHLDSADGTYYIQTENGSEYLKPHEHIQLDCLLTFGKNNGEED